MIFKLWALVSDWNEKKICKGQKMGKWWMIAAELYFCSQWDKLESTGYGCQVDNNLTFGQVTKKVKVTLLGVKTKICSQSVQCGNYAWVTSSDKKVVVVAAMQATTVPSASLNHQWSIAWHCFILSFIYLCICFGCVCSYVGVRAWACAHAYICVRVYVRSFVRAYVCVMQLSLFRNFGGGGDGKFIDITNSTSVLTFSLQCPFKVHYQQETKKRFFAILLRV